MDAQNYKNLSPKMFDFRMAIYKKIVNPLIFFVFSKRKCWKIEQEFKVEKEDGREAPMIA